MGRKSQELFKQAKRLIPGGVNSPVRAFGAVGGKPLFIEKAEGAHVLDADGARYIDYVLSWGPMILGHAHHRVIAAIADQSRLGTSYGAPTSLEVDLARLLVEAFPSLDKVRMVSSGTEAVMTAIRLARAATGRTRILKFEGCYHGHADSLLAKAGSGLATLGIPGSPGVPATLSELTITLPYNATAAFKEVIERMGDEIAAILVEPIAGNMGVVLPRPGFLETLRAKSRERGILLIFDEVISGFRLAYGGYSTLSGIQPDLTCLGKIIGGGLPVGAFGGRQDLMDMLAPIGSVYQAGTLSGNPLAMAAGIATLTTLAQENADGGYARLDAASAELTRGISALFARKGLPMTINRFGSMFTLFFQDGPVHDFKSATWSDADRFGRFFRAMLAEGVYMPPSQFEACFLSFAHTREDLAKTLDACDNALASL